MRSYTGLIDSLMAYVQNCVAANRCDDKVSAAPEGPQSRAPTHTPHTCADGQKGRRRQEGGCPQESVESVQSVHTAGGESQPRGLAGHCSPRVLHALSLEETLSLASLSAGATGLRREPMRGGGRREGRRSQGELEGVGGEEGGERGQNGRGTQMRPKEGERGLSGGEVLGLRGFEELFRVAPAGCVSRARLVVGALGRGSGDGGCGLCLPPTSLP